LLSEAEEIAAELKLKASGKPLMAADEIGDGGPDQGDSSERVFKRARQALGLDKRISANAAAMNGWLWLLSHPLTQQRHRYVPNLAFPDLAPL
jgi:hypothetical protein